MITRILLCLLLLTVLSGTTNGRSQFHRNAGRTTDTTGKMNDNTFLSFSDLHFNPFAFQGLTDTLMRSPVTQWDGIFRSVAAQYGLGYYGDDTNYNLFISALRKMKSVKPNPHFIVMSGDFISHDFGMNFQQGTGITNRDSLFRFVYKTLQFITNTIEAYFPGITLFPVLGNNDSYCGDYQAETSGIFYKQVSRLWYPLVKKVTSAQSFRKTFEAGGYYMASNPASSDHNIIVLNTIVYSSSYDAHKYPNYCKGTPNPSAGKIQLAWLKQQLQLCRQQRKKAWLLYHIPPGINAYASSGGFGNCKDNITGFWNDSSNNAFTTLLQQYRDVVQLNMAGHTHMDNFQLFLDSNYVPYNYIHITPSISPIFNNNPSFEEIVYNKHSLTLSDYTNYYITNLADSSGSPWDTEYTFSETYGVSTITPATLQQVCGNIFMDSITQRNYIRYYDVSNLSFTAITPKNFLAYWCAIACITKQQYAACACNQQSADFITPKAKP